MFTLPVCGVAGGGGSGVEEVVRGGEVTVIEREWLVSVAKQVREAVESVRLKDTGKIVLTFEEL